MFAISEGGALRKEHLFERVTLKLINQQENKAMVSMEVITPFSPERISHLKETLRKPFDDRADEQQNAQEQKQSQRLSDCSFPVSSMRLNEVWAECKLRLDIEAKEDLYDAIKSIDDRMSCEMGLNEEPSSVTLTRLKQILKVLRRENVMLAREDSGQQDESASQCPA